MITAYFRSSSLGTLSMCEMKYFFTYVLGMKDKQNKKATMGTVVHRALQVLGDKKKAQLNKKRKVKNDDIPDLTFKQCDDINYITRLCFDYYKENTPEVELTEKEYRQCERWVHKALEYNNGEMDPRNQNITDTELYFDIEIKKDWAKYEYVLDKKTISGYLSIKGTVDVIIKENDVLFRVLDYKGLPVSTPIPTPNGWSTMGDLNEGDLVFDRLGFPTKVIAKSSQSKKPCYKIKFDDTSEVVCDHEHRWVLTDKTVVSTLDLKVGDKIPITQGIECESKELPIDPYVLGIWLGDGRNRGGEITSGDDEVFQNIRLRGYKIGENLDKRKSKCESRTIYGLTTALKKLNLTHNKHIPDIYMRASYEQRLELLKGLMDSDGSVNRHRKQCVFMNCHKPLSKDVKALLLTLGQRPLMSQCEAYGFGVKTTSYPVSFRPLDINPFSLSTKKNKVDPEWGYGLSKRRKIVSIEKVEDQLTQCISVDSPTKTYLCTENLIPTHNTGKRLNWATGKEKTYECLQKDSQLLLYYYALKNMYPDRNFYMSIYYINDGGVFDLAFDEDSYKKAENILRQKFEYIKSVKIPNRISNDQENWKCKYLCNFSQIDEKSGKTICNHFYDMIKEEGITKVVNDHANLDKIERYGDGGGRLEGSDVHKKS